MARAKLDPRIESLVLAHDHMMACTDLTLLLSRVSSILHLVLVQGRRSQARIELGERGPRVVRLAEAKKHPGAALAVVGLAANLAWPRNHAARL